MAATPRLTSSSWRIREPSSNTPGNCPLDAPSHASMFTGRWPHELAVEQLGWLDATFPTLAEFLAARGYTTAGFVANQFFCGHETGLSRGYTHYMDYPVTPPEVLRSSSLGWFLVRTALWRVDQLHTGSVAGFGYRISVDFWPRTRPWSIASFSTGCRATVTSLFLPS